jgi:hypothetical protein
LLAVFVCQTDLLLLKRTAPPENLTITAGPYTLLAHWSDVKSPIPLEYRLWIAGVVLDVSGRRFYGTSLFVRFL